MTTEPLTALYPLGEATMRITMRRTLETQSRELTYHGASARFALAHDSHWTHERRAHYYAVMRAQIDQRPFSVYPMANTADWAIVDPSSDEVDR